MPVAVPPDLQEKREQFDRAIFLYENTAAYKLFGYAVATANVLLQAGLLARAWSLPIRPAAHLAALVTAYLAADLVNGLVHMYMDNNDDYVSPAGPLIAGFHLHHKLPRYADRSLPGVYFLETGSKVWLAPCLAAGLVFSLRPGAEPFSVYALAYFGVLSSVAEVSHYLVHNSLSPAAAALARAGLLLSKRRHGRHHTEDNVSYTFLNGFTDPVVDFIARKLYSGYKNGTDLHYANYKAPGRR